MDLIDLRFDDQGYTGDEPAQAAQSQGKPNSSLDAAKLILNGK